MHRYGIAIIGTGNVAHGHVLALKQLANAEVVAIGALEAEEGKRWAAEHGLECPVFTDLRELLREPSVEVVLICTPSVLHAQQGIQVAQAGKHIYVEKPIAMNRVELSALARAVADAGVLSQVGFVLRWNPGLRMAQHLVSSGAVGKVFNIETCYWHATPRAIPGHWMTTREAGSLFLMGGCHAVDAARWLAGSDIVEVQAMSTKGNKSWYEYDPTAVALVRFANGAVGRISASMECVMPYAFNFTVMGDTGTIRDNRLFSHLLPGQTDFATIPTQLPDSGSVLHHAFAGAWENFLGCIERSEQPDLSVAGAVNTHEVCLAVDLAAEQHRPITLPLAG
jgi:UDP-N-acetyl-2-amino-2-deoxyglucuronate dehydrogenase